MKDSAKLRRHLYLIRATEQPFTYPSYRDLIQHLLDHDFETIAQKTIERDLREIREEYGIPIRYSHSKHGFYLDLPDDEDISDFQDYVRLLERRERLETLTQSGRSVGQYLQLEHQDGGAASRFRGLDWLAPIWSALQRGLVITFQYRNYTEPMARLRRVEPGLLFEFRNRWYLDGNDLTVSEKLNGQRTYGLDRIQDLQLTAETISPRQIDYRGARRHVIGVTAPPDRQPEQVVLRFADVQREYVRSLPMHHSQTTLEETATHLTIALFVVLNPELERDILAYGEHVDVIEPASLRAKIAARVRTLAGLYVPENMY